MEPSQDRGAAVAAIDPNAHFAPAPLPHDAEATQQLSQQILIGMQRDIEAQIDWKLQRRTGDAARVSSLEVGLILGSIGIGLPLTAIAGAAAGLAGIVVVWIAMVLINIAWAVRR